MKTWDITRAIGKVTFREILRDKVLYNVLLGSLLLFGVSILASNLTVFRQERVLVDFGLTAMALSCLFIAILTGAGMIGREFDRRTVLVALSRPISRLQFVLGKFWGLSCVLALNWFLFVIVFLVILVAAAPGQGLGMISGAWFWAIFLVLLQSFLAGALAVFFSSFTTTSLAAIFTIGLYLVGSNISQLRWVATKATSPVAAKVLNGAAAVLPNFEHFQLGTKVVHGLPISFGFGFVAILYSAAWVAVCLLLAGLLLRRKDA